MIHNILYGFRVELVRKTKENLRSQRRIWWWSWGEVKGCHEFFFLSFNFGIKYDLSIYRHSLFIIMSSIIRI